MQDAADAAGDDVPQLRVWTGNWWDTPPILPSLSLKALATWLNSFHIYGFVLISGYLFAFKVRGGGYPDYSAFLKNKAKRLLIPYLFVAAVWLIPISIAMYGPDWNRLMDNYVLCKSPEQLWFLWMLFWVFALVWPVRNTVMAHPALGWAFALALYLVGIMGQRYLPNVFQIWTACQCMLFFLVGMRLRTSEEQGEKRSRKCCLGTSGWRWTCCFLCFRISRPGGQGRYGV